MIVFIFPFLIGKAKRGWVFIQSKDLSDSLERTGDYLFDVYVQSSTSDPSSAAFLCSTTAVAGEDRRRIGINNRGRGKKRKKTKKNTHIVISILRIYYLFDFSKHLGKKKVKSDRKISLLK